MLGLPSGWWGEWLEAVGFKKKIKQPLTTCPWCPFAMGPVVERPNWDSYHSAHFADCLVFGPYRWPWFRESVFHGSSNEV